MSRSSRQISDDTARFHQVVDYGDLEGLRAALQKGVIVDASGQTGATALMLAICARDLEKVKLLIQYGADPEITDDLNTTALRYAVEVDFAGAVRYLLGLGVDRGFHPRYPLKQVNYSFPVPEVPMPAGMSEVLSEAEWKESLEQTYQSIQEMGKHPTVNPMIADVQSVEVLKLFLEAGDDLNLAPKEIKRAFVELETGGELQVEVSDYRRHKSPQFGAHNPERMDFPFWKDMIRTGGNAYSARTKFADDHDQFHNPSVVWCFDRFGSTITQLGDGRFVQIGGEHEDFYDPDFYIYNDVVIHDGHGGVQIYGYPKEIFPPTDFHTATLCPDGIYIIGCLGYMDQRRPGFSPVYKLSLESWAIEPVRTSGEMPGWIHEHSVRYEPERGVISVAGGKVYIVDEDGKAQLAPNEQQYELDLARFQWRRKQ